MKKVKVRFSIATNYINSEYSEELEYEFEEDITDEELHDQLNELYTEWLFEKNYGCYRVL